MNLGAPELLIVLVVVLLLFGGAKLPKLARSLGEAKQEFERSTKHDEAVTEIRTIVVPVPEIPQKPDTVTMSREQLEHLIDERARRVTESPPRH